jgi:hypothetical protein
MANPNTPIDTAAGGTQMIGSPSRECRSIDMQTRIINTIIYNNTIIAIIARILRCAISRLTWFPTLAIQIDWWWISDILLEPCNIDTLLKQFGRLSTLRTIALTNIAVTAITTTTVVITGVITTVMIAAITIVLIIVLIIVPTIVLITTGTDTMVAIKEHATPSTRLRRVLRIRRTIRHMQTSLQHLLQMTSITLTLCLVDRSTTADV